MTAVLKKIDTPSPDASRLTPSRRNSLFDARDCRPGLQGIRANGQTAWNMNGQAGPRGLDAEAKFVHFRGQFSPAESERAV